MPAQFIRGAGYLIRGIGLMQKPGVRRFTAAPLGINILLFSALIYFGAEAFGRLIDRWVPDSVAWLQWLLWPLFALAALAVVFYLFILAANLVAAPFNGFLSEAVERRLIGPPGKSLPAESRPGIGRLIREAGASLIREMRKMLYYITRAIPLLVLFFIPVVNVAAPFLWIVFTAWMLALEFLSFPMENHGLDFHRQREALRRRPGLALGFGAAALLLTLIPVVNFLAMPAAVAGATAMWVEEYSRTADPNAS